MFISKTSLHRFRIVPTFFCLFLATIDSHRCRFCRIFRICLDDGDFRALGRGCLTLSLFIWTRYGVSPVELSELFPQLRLSLHQAFYNTGHRRDNKEKSFQIIKRPKVIKASLHLFVFTCGEREQSQLSKVITTPTTPATVVSC